MPDVVLAVDSGSQSSRALLFDGAGRVLGRGQAVHAPMTHPEAGAVEQDPHDILACTEEAIRTCLASWGGDAGDIRAAALTTQRNTAMPLDAAGRPIADAISWLDRRRAAMGAVPSRGWKLALGLLGDAALIPRLVSRSWPLLWRERGLTDRLARIATVEAWLHQQLVGVVAVAPGGVAGPWPFDVARRRWTQGGILYSILGYEASWLPDVVEAGQRVGGVTAAAAARTGLPEGLPFYACGGDKQAEALGAGVRIGKTGIAEVSLGTGSSVSVPWPEARQSLRYDWICTASAEPRSWTLEYMVFRGMWTARWFARQLARDLAPAAADRGLPVEALLCEEAAALRPGADGLVALPRWSPSLQHPQEAGAWVGLRETHTRAHMFRALLEGIVLDLRRGVETLERATGSHIIELRVGGGGAHSDLLVQMLADGLRLPVLRPAELELSARGAAIVAAAAGGLHPSLSQAVAAMVPEAERITPDPAAAATYDTVFREAWRPALRRLR